MRILFLTNLLPYPLDNGGKIKTYTTLKALYSGNNQTDLVCFKEQVEDHNYQELDKICHSVHEVFQRLTTANNKKYMMLMAAKSLLSIYPLSSYKFISREMSEYLSSLASIDYDLIYYDHLPMYVYYRLCKKYWPKARVILDEHNCEATIMKRNAETSSNRFKRAFMFYEASKVEKFESCALLSADKSIILSDADYNTLRNATGKDFDHTIIPIGVTDKGLKKQCNPDADTISILFVGTLTWEPNNQGLIWFIDNVIPRMEKEGIKYKLYIVGKNPSEQVMLKTKDNENITVTGYVDSVDPYYDLCDITVVPLFIGSGQRVKLIEAFSKGMPAVSTTIGAEGLAYEDRKNIVIADSSQQFIDGINLLKNERVRASLGGEARKTYEEHYSPNAVAKQLLEALRS